MVIAFRSHHTGTLMTVRLSETARESTRFFTLFIQISNSYTWIHGKGNYKVSPIKRI